MQWQQVLAGLRSPEYDANLLYVDPLPNPSFKRTRKLPLIE